MRELDIRRLGRVPYADALALQRALVEERRAGRIEDTLLLVEHPHVLTLGVKGDGGRSHILAAPEALAARGIDVHETGRGGDITYHGPGQIVGYPIVDLKPDRCDVHRYVRDLEEVLIRTAGDYGVAAATGVRASPASGSATASWPRSASASRAGSRATASPSTSATDLSYFDLIVPCGIADRGVTSLERLLGRAVDRRDVEDRVAAHFCEVFERQPSPALAAHMTGDA